MASVHCSGSVKKPSSLRSTAVPAMVVVDMVSPPWWPGVCLPAVGMVGAEAGEVAAGQQAVPVDGLEQQLAEVVEPGLLEQRQPDRGRVVAGERFGVVVEVDEQGLVEPGLDEAVGVPVEPGLERLAGEEPRDVADEGLALEVGDRAGLGGGHVGGVADDEDVRRRLRLQGVLVGGHEVELVAEPGRAADVGGAAVQRDDDGEVEGDLAAVVADQAAAGAVDLAGVELGDQLDAPLGEHPAEVLGRRPAW